MIEEKMTPELFDEIVTRSRKGFNHAACPDNFQDCDDARMICEEYLRITDPTPIKEANFYTLGFKKTNTNCFEVEMNNYFSLQVYETGIAFISYNYGNHHNDIVEIAQVRTFQDLINLCKHLRIRIKESQ